MKDTYIINTHSHANMLRQTNIDEAIKNAQNEKIITIVPSSSAEDIFEVDKFIQKYPAYRSKHGSSTAYQRRGR